MMGGMGQKDEVAVVNTVQEMRSAILRGGVLATRKDGKGKAQEDAILKFSVAVQSRKFPFGEDIFEKHSFCQTKNRYCQEKNGESSHNSNGPTGGSSSGAPTASASVGGAAASLLGGTASATASLSGGTATATASSSGGTAAAAASLLGGAAAATASLSGGATATAAASLLGGDAAATASLSGGATAATVSSSGGTAVAAASMLGGAAAAASGGGHVGSSSGGSPAASSGGATSSSGPTSLGGGHAGPSSEGGQLEATPAASSGGGCPGDEDDDGEWEDEDALSGLATTHQSRNPLTAVLRYRPQHKKPRGPNLRATQRKKHESKSKRERALAEDLLKLHEDREAQAEVLAEAHHMNIKEVKCRMVSGTKYKSPRKTSSYNALVSLVMKDLNEDRSVGTKYRMQEVKLMIKEDPSLKDLYTSEQIDDMREELDKKKALWSVGVRATNQAAAVDAKWTIDGVTREITDMATRNNMVGFAMFVKGDIHDTHVPAAIESLGALKFFTDVFHKDPADVLTLFELWSVTQKRGGAVPTTVAEFQKACGEKLRSGLQLITGQTNITMNFERYIEVMVCGRGIGLVIWPRSVVFKRMSKQTCIGDLQRLYQDLVDGTCKWKAKIEEQFEELVRSGQRVEKVRQSRSDRGQLRHTTSAPASDSDPWEQVPVFKNVQLRSAQVYEDLLHHRGGNQELKNCTKEAIILGQQHQQRRKRLSHRGGDSGEEKEDEEEEEEDDDDDDDDSSLPTKKRSAPANTSGPPKKSTTSRKTHSSKQSQTTKSRPRRTTSTSTSGTSSTSASGSGSKRKSSGASSEDRPKKRKRPNRDEDEEPRPQKRKVSRENEEEERPRKKQKKSEEMKRLEKQMARGREKSKERQERPKPRPLVKGKKGGPPGVRGQST
ncbi:hypothetical protein K438DRAFT_1763680 [Mycena galopus ATCC 62051]|nr:hypothetical protein K438DRAFT_1763680 [Mycena galopus ATCC 62051]